MNLCFAALLLFAFIAYVSILWTGLDRFHVFHSESDSRFNHSSLGRTGWSRYYCALPFVNTREDSTGTIQSFYKA